MRILFIDQFSDLGGAQLALREVMAETVRRGADAWFAAPSNGELFSFCESAGIHTQCIPVGAYRRGSKNLLDVSRYGLDMLRTARLIGQTARRCQIDLVYVNGPRVLSAAALATGARCPLIFHLHSSLRKRYSRAIARVALNGTRGAVIAASQYVAAELRPLKGNPIHVIHNGVNDCGYVPSSFFTRNLTIGIIGRISHEKGHADFMRAASALAARGHKLRFLIIGAALSSNPGFEKRLHETAAGSPVKFCGWTNDVASALHRIDILAAPCSAHECCPRVVLEAFSAGTPVVAYPSGGIPELIRDGETGVLTKGKTHEALATAMEALLANPELMSRISANARLEWERRFRPERFLGDVARVIERWGDVKRRQTQSPSAVAREDNLTRVGAPHR